MSALNILHKYPRTPHVMGSRKQVGDGDLAYVRLDGLRGETLVIEEKVDGANAGLSFGPGGELRLQCRGHYLTGGPRERQFSLFKRWAYQHYGALYERLGRRYLMYGEWCYAKHTMFYDALPHYFLEFDVLDRERGVFLSTDARRALLEGSPVVSVPVLWRGLAEEAPRLTTLVGCSLMKSARWRTALRAVAVERGLDPDRVRRQTDGHDDAEGLYLKVERDGQTVDRMKYVRPSFTQSIEVAGDHWMERPLLPNGLAPGVDIFGTWVTQADWFRSKTV